MRKLESRVLGTVRRHSMLEGVGTVLVALSGGPDSVTLLLALLELRRLLGIEVVAAHVNHGRRGRDSDGDEEFARLLCERLGVPFSSRRLEPLEFSRSGNLERRLRRLRYQALFEMSPPGAVAATGHTLDDQVETFFMKVSRGAGVTGLAGIYPVRAGVTGMHGERLPLRVIRPLIEIRRRDVLQYLEERGQEYCSDASNQDLSLDRNWVRARLVPELQTRLNPKILENVGRSTELLRQVQVYLRARARKALNRCLLERRGETRLNVPLLGRLPPALLNETLRLAVGRARGTLRGLRQAHVSAMAGLVRSRSGKSVDIGGGWRVSREFDELRFSTRVESDFEIQLSIPGHLFVQQLSATIQARRVDAGEGRSGSIRLDLRGDSLVARNPRPGDRIRLDRGWVKLKDLWLERRIPLSSRRRLIVLESGGELAWVEGIGVGKGFEPSATVSQWVEIDIATETFGG